MAVVAAVIRRARTGARLSQAELAAWAGTSQPALARYETGATLATLPTLEGLLSACGRRLELRAVRATSTAASDIDLLVDLEPRRTLLDLAAFRREAEEILGTPVDVATLDMLEERIRADVEAEAIPL